MKNSSTNTTLREPGAYTARNSSKGALIDEAFAVFSAMHTGMDIAEVREQALSGKLLRQRSGENRRRIWELVQKRYLQPHIVWLREAICSASDQGSESTAFRSLLYLLYALRDRLTFDFVTESLWVAAQPERVVSRNDVLDFLDHEADGQPQTKRWTEGTRTKLAGSILTALRDFGVLSGRQKKVLAIPVLPTRTAEVIVRILIGEGVRGRAVIESPLWRLFFLSESDVVAILGKLAREHVIRFEKAGSIVVLDTPPEWEVSCVE